MTDDVSGRESLQFRLAKLGDSECERGEHSSLDPGIVKIELISIMEKFGVAGVAEAFSSIAMSISDDGPSLSPVRTRNRSPLASESYDVIIEAVGLPLILSDPCREGLHLIFAQILDAGVGHVQVFRRRAPIQRLMDYVGEITKFIKANNEAKIFVNGPPALPDKWTRDTVAWAHSLIAEENAAASRGRPKNVGSEEFFKDLLVLYRFCFGRAPSATPHGPTHRFCRAVWDQLATVDMQPRWPGLDDRAMIARISGARRELTGPELSEKTRFIERMYEHFSAVVANNSEHPHV